jgi:hypothetical protein
MTETEYKINEQAHGIVVQSRTITREEVIQWLQRSERRRQSPHDDLMAKAAVHFLTAV